MAKKCKGKVSYCSEHFFLKTAVILCLFFLPLSFLHSEEALSKAGGIDIPDTPYAKTQIKKYIDQYTKPFGKQQLYDVLDGGELYRLYVRQELKKRGMPAALEYLPVVESDYNPLAVSRSGAKGLWQFMDNSIAGLLKKTEWIDERYDPWKSTDAALTKLQENYTQFKDWPVAIAAYNCGAGAMKRILAKSPVKTFWYISENSLLRDQSVQYVPKLLAICTLAENPEHYGITLPEVTKSTLYAEFDYLPVKEEINLDRLASELKMDSAILKKLNSALLKDCTPPSSIYQLRLPPGMKNSAAFAAEVILNHKSHVPPARGKTVVHTVTPGETLWSISKKYGVTVESIQLLNGLKSGDTLPAGKKLYIKQ